MMSLLFLKVYKPTSNYNIHSPYQVYNNHNTKQYLDDSVYKSYSSMKFPG